MNKKRIQELKIINEHPKLRPYGSYISFILGDNLQYGYDGEASLLIDTAYSVRIIPDLNKKQRNEHQKFTAVIEGFKTAREAEEMGLKLALSLLWTAISKNWSLKLMYDTPLPSIVFNRKKRNNIYRLTGHDARMQVTSTPAIVSKLISDVLIKNPDINPKLLISMELFASAKMESSERARFVSLVSALEALSKSASYENEVLDGLVKEFVNDVRDSLAISDGDKESIIGRAFTLRNESIIQSIISYVSTFFLENKNIKKLLKDSYNLRSSILHEGTIDSDLEEKRIFLENVLRKIYSHELNLNLQHPIDNNLF